MNILIINGPNLNLLGKREPSIYGSKTYADLLTFIKKLEKKYSVKTVVKQSNYEGEIIEWLQKSDDDYDGVILNAGALTHYSYSIYDAIKSIQNPVVETHISNLTNRESFRKVSVIKPACIATVMGLGFKSYENALQILLEKSDSQ
jgi:3-dehydroquinate dehydratase-2